MYARKDSEVVVSCTGEHKIHWVSSPLIVRKMTVMLGGLLACKRQEDAKHIDRVGV